MAINNRLDDGRLEDKIYFSGLLFAKRRTWLWKRPFSEMWFGLEWRKFKILLLFLLCLDVKLVNA